MLSRTTSVSRTSAIRAFARLRGVACEVDLAQTHVLLGSPRRDVTFGDGWRARLNGARRGTNPALGGLIGNVLSALRLDGGFPAGGADDVDKVVGRRWCSLPAR